MRKYSLHLADVLMECGLCEICYLFPAYLFSKALVFLLEQSYFLFLEDIQEQIQMPIIY